MRNELFENDEKLKDAMNNELSAMEIPESLSPEQMTARLKEQKRKSIRISKKAGFRAVAALCACLVLVVGLTPTILKHKHITPLTTSKCYMDNVGSYHKLYEQMQYLAAEYKKSNKKGLFNGARNKVLYVEDMVTALYDDTDYILEAAEAPAVMDESSSNALGEATNANVEAVSGKEVSETLTQVEGISESDIVKCDGNTLYILRDCKLYYTSIDNGKIGEVHPLTVQCDLDGYIARDLYLVDGNLIAICNGGISDNADNMCCVATFSHGEDGTLVQTGICYQDGSIVDTRIKDSMLYLVTSTYKEVTEDIKENDLSSYVPRCGEGTDCYVEPDDILIPDSWNNCFGNIQYELVSAVDIHSAELRDSKALAGGSGTVYMTQNALYLSSSANDGQTRISRIEYNGGEITPKATALIQGNPINQYAMHETENAFFIATSGFETIMSEDGKVASTGARKNFLYSFDLSMNQLDRIDYAERESIKAVNYVDNYAYVVTFLQTDPLFCIDCTTPDNLTILDEFKVSGYSTFLYPWNNHLLSFGIESGETNGIKLMMYDTDENGKLTMLDDHVWASAYGDTWWWENEEEVFPTFISSPAANDYKALYLHPEKNLIAVPLSTSNTEAETTQYVFLQYNEETNQFEELGTINMEKKQSLMARCISVDDVFYLISKNAIVSVDGNSFTQIKCVNY